MIVKKEATGKTVDAAVLAAAKALGVTPDDVSVEVLSLPKSGFLGIGAQPAKVCVSYDDGKSEPVKPAPQKSAKPASKPAENAPAKAPKAEAKPAVPATGALAEETEKFLKGLMEHMEVECTMTITQRENGGLDVKLDGPNMGAVIGRRGETLDAIQHLVNYAVNRSSDKHMHINVDAEDYRSKREDSLVHLAEKMAAKAIKYKRSMALEPMNSYERHVIHTALQDYPGVSTSSTGVEPNRRVVVNYERGDQAEEAPRPVRERRSRPPRKNGDRPAAAPVKAAEEAPVVMEEKPADFPADYVPAQKNKPQSREWC